MIVSVPDTNGRYYLLPLYDMWTDVFAVPGKRTTGTHAHDFAVVPPGWHGTAPDGVERIHAPTPYVWIVGRTQTNGPADYDAVHVVQDGYTITPLSNWGHDAQPVQAKTDPTVDMQTPPLQQVNGMSAAEYFGLAAELLKLHPPHLDRLVDRRADAPGGSPARRELRLRPARPRLQARAGRRPRRGLKLMQATLPRLAKVVNGWQMNTDSMGSTATST